MKIYDNTDEPKVNGYILGNQNHIGSVDVVDAVRWDGKIHGIFIAEYPNWRQSA